MIESLLILNILTLAIIGAVAYFYTQSLHIEQKHRLETAINLYEKIINDLQSEKIHLYNCFLDKQHKPPLGVDLKAERQQRIEIEKKQKEDQPDLIGIGIVAKAQRQAQLDYEAQRHTQRK